MARGGRRGRAARVMYGSDGPVCSPRLEVEKVRLAGLSVEDTRLVLADNALGLIQNVTRG